MEVTAPAAGERTGHPRVPGPHGGRLINNSRLAAELQLLCLIWVTEQRIHTPVISPGSVSCRSLMKRKSDFLYAKSQSDIWLRDLFVQQDIITGLTFSL